MNKAETYRQARSDAEVIRPKFQTSSGGIATLVSEYGTCNLSAMSLNGRGRTPPGEMAARDIWRI